MIGTVAGFIAFAIARGVTVTDAQAGVALTKASDYIDGKDWDGIPTTEAAWPRTGLVYSGSLLIDAQGSPIVAEVGDIIDQPVTPQKVITASYRLALESAGGVDLQPTVTSQQVVEERVEGVIDMKYSEAWLGVAPSFPWFDSLVYEWIIQSQWSGCQINVWSA